MKHRKQNYITFVCVVFILLSCENQDNEITQTSTEQIQEARLWFEENYESFDFKNAIAPVWTKAIHHGHIIEVGFTVDGKLPVPKAPGLSLKFSGRQRLLIKKAGRSFELEIVSYIPSNKNKVNISGVNLTTWREGFHGKIVYENLNSKERHVDYVSSGQVISTSRMERITPGVQDRSMGDCGWDVSIDWYRFTGQEWDHYETTYEYWAEECPEGGSGGGYDPGDWADSGNGGTGGSTGSGGFDDCIEINVTNECINNVAQHVLNPNLVGTFNSLIQDVFNSSETVNLIIQDGVLGDNVMGTTSHVISSGDVANVITTLDPAKFAGTSKEFVAANIYHECFHALVNYLADDAYSQNEEHVAMFTSYLNLLADGLQTAYPNLAPGDAKGLILNGAVELENLGLWPSEFVDRVLTHSQFTRPQINVIAARHKTNSSGTSCN